MTVCPECGKRLPSGTAFQHGAGFGLPDRRSLDCPYCGAPLEPVRWTTLAALFVILAVALAARKLIEPLLDWRVVAFLVVLVVAYHALPGLGVDSAQQIIAEIGPGAEAFPSAAQLASWVGVCPG